MNDKMEVMETPMLPAEKKIEEKKPKSEHQYSRDALLSYASHPLSKKLPPCLELPLNKSILSGRTRWSESEQWQSDRKRFDSPVEEDYTAERKCRLGDPKERIKKEHDVVLSPQRRSFNTGCFVTPQHFPPPNRRLENTVKDRYERRRFERRNEPHEKERSWDRNSRYGSNNNDRRRYDSKNEEEPEWFSEGPTSQHDTIELRGFDDEEKLSKKKNDNKSNSRLRKSSDPAILATSRDKVDSQTKKGKKSPLSSALESPKPEPPKETTNTTPLNIPIPEQELKPVSELKDNFDNFTINSDFNLEDIFNFDSLPSLLPISNGCKEETCGSRFSQFFRKESPSPQLEIQNVQEDMLNMMSDMKGTHILIPPEGNNYFSPISPAATSLTEPQKNASFLELLQRGNKEQDFGRKITKKSTIKDMEVSGKVHSVEEVEARIRQQQGMSRPVDVNKEEEINVFRKLLQSKVIQPEQKPYPILSTTPVNPQPQISQDVFKKFIQTRQNQEIFSNLMVNPVVQQNRLTPHPPQFNVPPPFPLLSTEMQLLINNTQPTQEIFQRPEAQNLIRSLNRGEITIIHLIEQLKKASTMQPLRRDIIASIIKIEQHHRQAAVQRVPSPRDLQAHTQGIMQSALLKKILEDQKENYKKRQEMQRSRSPNVNVSVSPAKTTSPTPLAFTPTSVLRKMTADKDPDPMKTLQDANQKQHEIFRQTQHRPPPTTQFVANNWNTMLKPQQGRPIVKGGMFPATAPSYDYMNVPTQYRATPLPQQTQFMAPTNRVRNIPNYVGTPPPQQWTMNPSISYATPTNPRNIKPDPRVNMRSGTSFMGYPTAPSTSPVSNQLAKWFSPELLAQARAGKLPGIPTLSPTQHMLSVEELERQSVRSNK